VSNFGVGRYVLSVSTGFALCCKRSELPDVTVISLYRGLYFFCDR